MKKTSTQMALVLSGGGARAAYQVGFLRYLARNYPHLHIPILTGVSAGAINAAYLANHRGSFPQAVAGLEELWKGLRVDEVFYADVWALARKVFRWGGSLVSGGMSQLSSARGLVDTEPLRSFLHRNLGSLQGVRENLKEGRLQALALTGTNYATAQSVTWIQGNHVTVWERPNRYCIKADIAIEHVLASAALPLFFPAVRVGNDWYGDGGIRQAAPLSPALHLGADRILAITTRYDRTMEEAMVPAIRDYPPPAQIIGTLMNSVFLDVLDKDARHLELVNDLLEKMPERKRDGHRLVSLFLLRPSQELGKLAGGYEDRLPGVFRFLNRGLGTSKTKSHDWLSMIMFEPGYVEHLMDIGESDAAARSEEIASILEF